ncbi:MAG: 2-amino-4-hydroxy-6-hydroxymethyldihydropteridine diphosphokinase [Acidiferrobacteraceae bacterium]|nr:2-amino-4-hydroxy-6-hydroxymethyldihydropteridine diphosphokinase [Acidiferrobacteraceae bacterium]
MARVAVGVGSNLDREMNIRAAVTALRSRFGPLLCSPIYESAAHGFEGPPFYNLVIVFNSPLDIEMLYKEIRTIEALQGRGIGADRRGSRSLDIDLLLYGQSIRYSEGIDIPRREIPNHSYILKPLADVLPLVNHPICSETFGDMWNRLNASLEQLILIEHIKLN